VGCAATDVLQVTPEHVTFRTLTSADDSHTQTISARNLGDKWIAVFNIRGAKADSRLSIQPVQVWAMRCSFVVFVISENVLRLHFMNLLLCFRCTRVGPRNTAVYDHGDWKRHVHRDIACEAQRENLHFHELHHQLQVKATDSRFLLQWSCDLWRIITSAFDA